MKGLDDREQRWALWGAGAAAAAFVAFWAPSFDRGAAVGLAAIGCLMAAGLALAARRRSRLLTGLAAVLLGFGPWGGLWLLGFPYLILAARLTMRATRIVPRQATPETVPPPEPRTSVPAKRAGPGPRPQATRRYTPPKGRG